MRYSVPLLAYGAGLCNKVDGTRDRAPKTADKPGVRTRSKNVAVVLCQPHRQ